jgi:Chalcone isomerase-like
MRLAFVLSASLAALTFSLVRAQEKVGVSGSSFEFDVAREAKVGDKKYSLKLTGAAMRKRAIIKVYAIGSYVDKDFAGRTAEELATVDTIKQLHLVMERNVDGADMAKAFQEAIKNNYPNQFTDEVKKLVTIMEAQSADKGDHVWITHVPGYGIHVNLPSKKTSEFIAGVKFAKAVWDIYLGPKNVGESVKKGLTSRLN